MTPRQIRAQLLLSNRTTVSIARKLGVSRQLVSHVIHRRLDNSRVRAAVADAIGVAYQVVWGVPDPDSNRYRDESTTEPIAEGNQP